MKFLVDAQLPPGLCRWLGERGHHAEHVFDTGLGVAPDIDLVRHAIQSGAMLVSKDEDFVPFAESGEISLLRLRCGNITNRALDAWSHRWGRVVDLLERGETLIELV